MSSSINKIRDVLDSIEKDFSKHKEGTKAAGTRCRKLLQEVKALCHEMRKEILAEQKERKESKEKKKASS